MEVAYASSKVSNLVVKTKVHKLGARNVASTLCGKDETVKPIFWTCNPTKTHQASFQIEFHFLFTTILSWKGPFLGDTWMISDNTNIYGT